MTPVRLDHITIRTGDIEGTRDVLMAVFDLKLGARPLAIQRIPGCWLYANGEPIVHLVGSPFGWNRAAPSSEAIDHIGMRIGDAKAFEAKLKDRQIPFQKMQLEELCETRIFFFLPGGQLIEAVSREP